MARIKPTQEEIIRWQHEREQEEKLLLSLPDEEFEIEKCGFYYFYNLKSTRERCIQTPFQSAKPFKNGLAIVQYGHEWGMINKIGETVIPFIYNEIRDYRSSGFIFVYISEKQYLGKCVIQHGRWGAINETGEEVIPIKYHGIQLAGKELVRVSIPEVINPEYDKNGIVCRCRLSAKFGYIDQTGKEITPIKYKEGGVFRNGLARVRLNDKHGFINTKGEEIIPLKYDSVSNFREGHACVKLNGKYGFLNTNGEEIIPLKYDSASDFSEGLACVKLNGKYGFLNTNGEEIIPLKYDSASNFSEGLAYVKLNGKYGFLNTKGEEIIPLKYDYASDFREGLACVKLNGKYGFLNTKGETAIPFVYDGVHFFSLHSELIKVEIGSKWHEIDHKGNIVNYDIPDPIMSLFTTKLHADKIFIKRPNGKYENINSKQEKSNDITPKDKYSIVGEFHDELARVKRNGKWGYVTKDYIEIIPCEYENAFDFHEGCARIKQNGKWGYINKTGRLITGCHFDNANDFHEGLAAVEYKGKWGYKSKSGYWAILPEYSFASDFSDGKALVRKRIIFGIDETLYIDKDGYKIR